MRLTSDGNLGILSFMSTPNPYEIRYGQHSAAECTSDYDGCCLIAKLYLENLAHPVVEIDDSEIGRRCILLLPTFSQLNPDDSNKEALAIRYLYQVYLDAKAKADEDNIPF